MQNFTIRKGKPSSAFQEKINQVITKLQNTLIPALEKSQMVLTGDRKTILDSKHNLLASIPDFQSLVALMQDASAPSTPVYEIDESYLGVGTVKENYLQKICDLYSIFSDFADLFLELTKDE